MNVMVIADPLLPVPPQGYGGTERIVGWLCDGLLSRGHSVTLVAGAGSRAGSRLVIHRAPGRAFASRVYRKVAFQITSVLAARGADVVHNFGRIDYTEALVRLGTRVVYTFQNPVADWERSWLVQRTRHRESIALVGISDAHCRDAGPDPRWSRVYNAVDTDVVRPPVRRPSRDYLAFLGRMTRNKGIDTAISVARATGMRLRIAGNVSGEQGGREFFERSVRPHLGSSIEWVGEIGDADKSEFLGNARALLFPVRWEEPFGIVIAEALSAGTPVIGMKRGSVPELVEDGVTGFLVGNEDEMSDAVQRVECIDARTCRSEALSRFSISAMVDAYLRIYSSLVGH